jgi:hypothetical protein
MAGEVNQAVMYVQIAENVEIRAPICVCSGGYPNPIDHVNQ